MIGAPAALRACGAFLRFRFVAAFAMDVLPRTGRPRIDRAPRRNILRRFARREQTLAEEVRGWPRNDERRVPPAPRSEPARRLRPGYSRYATQDSPGARPSSVA